MQSLGVLGAAWLADGLRAEDLPLKNTGLEHYGVTVPDPEVTARFYGRIFDPQLFQEREPPPRFYVKVGISYWAFGGNAQSTPFMDHFCVLTEGYKQGEVRKVLEDAGVKMGAGPLGMATDPDGLRMQTLNVPGGLARTIVPAFRISQDEALFQAIATDHVMLHVTNLEASVAHYKKLFGPELPRTKKPERAWFQVAHTRLGLEQVPSGEKPSIHHVSIKVAGFDRKVALAKLKRAGIEAMETAEKAVQFKDPHGLITEIKAES